MSAPIAHQQLPEPPGTCCNTIMQACNLVITASHVAELQSWQVLVGEDSRKRMYMLDAGGNLYYDSGNREVGFFQVRHDLPCSPCYGIIVADAVVPILCNALTHTYLALNR